MNNESGMEHALKRGAVILGVLILGISIYLSYDGFDQGVTGGNSKYSGLAKLIGIVIAISISVLQFIFSSRYEQLNTTLKTAALAGYGYSIYTNYLGAENILHMNGVTAIATAVFLDVIAEPMIAYGLGDSAKGDVLGNIGKWFAGYQPKPQQAQQQNNQNNHPKSGNDQERKKGEHTKPFNRREELQNMYFGEDRRGQEGKGEHHKAGQNQNNRPKYDR